MNDCVQEGRQRLKHEKRREIILDIKADPSYKEFLLTVERGEVLPDEVPGAPDPGR